MSNISDALAYDPLSGSFTWLLGKAKGKLAGSPHKHTGYVVIKHMGKPYYAHRLAWYLTTGHWPLYIDHQNGVKTDNRLSNLREVSKRENHRNMKCFSTSTTKITGVSRHKQTNKWRAYITVNSKHISLGCFESFEAACLARKQAETSH